MTTTITTEALEDRVTELATAWQPAPDDALDGWKSARATIAALIDGIEIVNRKGNVLDDWARGSMARLLTEQLVSLWMQAKKARKATR